ncbi:hypothetical protein LZ554_009257 [Drepanopeziza brunnea f. sp. 'monogermtubi']|nr:hypothetical protein LZ554_009257 [Drepanopeziza brunnea f. sp. 'monogermtubi']
MMFINAIVAAAILAASVVTAAPAAEVLAPRQARTIKLCRSKHWTSCANSSPAAPGACQNLSWLPGVGDFTDLVSSLDTRGAQCTFFV